MDDLIAFDYVPPTISDDVWMTADDKRAAGTAFMHADLERSGLNYQDMKTLPANINPENGQQLASYIIPFNDPWTGNSLVYPDGDRKGELAMWRKRIDWDLYTPDNEKHRYIQPKKEDVLVPEFATCPYLPPGFAPLKDGFEPRGALYIAEGEKKALSMRTHFDVDVIAITGCWNWRIAGTKRLHTWINDIASQYQEVVIVPDGDVGRSDIGVAYTALKSAIQEIVPNVRMIDLGDKDNKIDDMIADGLSREAFDDLPECHVFFDNPERLVREFGLPHTRTKEGGVKIIPNELTALTLMRGHPILPKVSLNLDTQRVSMDGVDQQMSHMYVLETMQGTLGLHMMKPTTVQSALSTVLLENQHSPRADWLDSLEWDGKERLAELFIDYCNALVKHEEHAEWLRTLAERWLVNACQRLFEPACQSDYMVISYGKQGVGKSRFVKTLFGPSACVTIFKAGDKDTRMMLNASWCSVFEELAAKKHTEKEDLKALLTETTDTFRPPYGKEVAEFPRRCVYYGTTNDPEPLQQDESGYRRWCIVEFGTVDIDRLAEDRDQLWAEAMVAYRNGDQPDNGWMEVPEFVFEGRIEIDPVIIAFQDAWNKREDTQEFETSLFRGSNMWGGTLSQIKDFMGSDAFGRANGKAFTKDLKNYLLANGWEYFRQKTFADGSIGRNVLVIDNPKD